MQSYAIFDLGYQRETVAVDSPRYAELVADGFTLVEESTFPPPDPFPQYVTEDELGDVDVDVSWADVTGKPATFPPTIGTTSTTAKAGDYQPTYAQVTGKPSTFPPDAHTHAWGEVTGKPSTFTPADHSHEVADVTGLQAIVDDFEARIAALETPAG